MFRQKTSSKTKNTISTETASLTKVKDLMLTAFSCIGYIREIFPEEDFKNERVGELRVKRLARGRSKEGDSLLNWLEVGCMDAIKHKYLKQVVFGIYENPDTPTVMSETYTLRIAYPNQPNGNENDEAMSANDEHSILMDSVFKTLENNADSNNPDTSVQSIKVSDTSDDQFSRATRKIIKSLICFMQTLKDLPEKRYLTMQLHYFDNVTPESYEPQGFQRASESMSLITFAAEPTALPLGKVSTEFHQIQVGIATTKIEKDDDGAEDHGKDNDHVDDGDGEDDEDEDEDQMTMIPPSQKRVCADHHTHSIGSSLHLPPACISNSQLELNGSIVNTMDEFEDKNDLACSSNSHVVTGLEKMSMADCVPDKTCNTRKTRSSTIVVPQSSQNTDIMSMMKPVAMADDAKVDNSEVKCSCGVNESDLDMIECDECHQWQHTVCMGFFSNRDSRIPQKFVCYSCQYPKAPFKITQFLQNRCQFRRTLSIIYQEGFQSQIQLSRRLGVGLKRTRRIQQQLAKEGFIQVKTGHIYDVVKNSETRQKVKSYFLTDIDAQPDFLALMQHENYSSQKNEYTFAGSKRASIIYNPPSKKRKVSIPEEDISLC